MAIFNSYFDITRGYTCLFQGDDACVTEPPVPGSESQVRRLSWKNAGVEVV